MFPNNQLVLHNVRAPVRLSVNGQLKTDDAFYKFCVANPDLRLERSPEGDVIVMPPAGGESDYRCVDASTQLRLWSKKNGRGKAFGSSVEFFLPSGAAYSPDAAWVSNKQLSRFTKEQLRKFLPLSPEFVIEVMSPSDRLKAAQKKMQAWLAEGVDLAWLIDADHKTLYIYRAGATQPEKRTGITKVAAEGPVKGFVLNLKDIWAGL